MSSPSNTVTQKCFCGTRIHSNEECCDSFDCRQMMTRYGSPIHWLQNQNFDIPDSIPERNRDTVLEALRKCQFGLTQKNLSYKTGLKVSQVSKILKSLADQFMVTSTSWFDELGIKLLPKQKGRYSLVWYIIDKKFTSEN